MARSVLVAGGGGGLGGAVVGRLAADGWRVVVADRRPGSAEMPREAQYVIADLFDPDAAASAVEVAAGDPDSPLGAVVNLVGGFAAGGLVHETPVDEFEEQLRLN
ncbi:MAG: SDR family NAD(P)-dependent oxidoreductase, partial [Dactylosporangium sp.]|nr:SDR family NAD(P)-dependent oxidoreductase [Dactylosporangium sp.]